MLLAIDIGNTSISLGVLSQHKVRARYHVDTFLSKRRIRPDLTRLFRQIKKKHPSISAVVLCSVVPSLTAVMNSYTKTFFRLTPLVIGRDLIVPIKNNYYNPQQVGQDRLVGAYAVKMLYGFPSIIIDFGTAITFDVVSAKGGYEGGIIIPGLRLSAESLFQKTAMLPRVEDIKIPRHLIGKDTRESILSGLFFGYGAMSCGLIDVISRHLKRKVKVVVTGGYTHLMRKFIINKIDVIDNDLVFKGLSLLYSTLKF